MSREKISPLGIKIAEEECVAPKGMFRGVLVDSIPVVYGIGNARFYFVLDDRDYRRVLKKVKSRRTAGDGFVNYLIYDDTGKVIDPAGSSDPKYSGFEKYLKHEKEILAQ